MKQHIRPNQVLEISEDEFYSLFDCLVKRKDYAKYHHKKMTVGKMLEILIDNSIAIEINTNSKDINNKPVIMVKDITFGSMYKSIELCDALWCVVKDTLKSK